MTSGSLVVAEPKLFQVFVPLVNGRAAEKSEGRFRLFFGGHRLREIAEITLPHNIARKAGVGRVSVVHEPQQGGFAVSLLADDRRLFSALQRKGEIGKQGAVVFF